MTDAMIRRTAVSILLMVAAAPAAAGDAAVVREPAELRLNEAVSLLVEEDEQGASAVLDAVIREHPEFFPAQLLKADMLAAHAGQTPLIGLEAAQGKIRIANLVEEARARYNHRPDYAGKMPDAILRLAPIHRHALLFDAARSRLYLFENRKDSLRLAADYYASHGRNGMDKYNEGDGRTPTGAYRIHQLHSDGQLPELYGEGAYTLDYPNSWDRLMGHGGDGIWLHGVPRLTYSRPPLASRGCIVVSNDAFARLRAAVKTRAAPMILAKRVNWLGEEDWLARRSEMTGVVRRWQEDWQSLDVEKYLSHYSGEYRDKKMDYRKMLAVTRHNATFKTFVKVDIRNLDLVIYTRASRLIAATRFDQSYTSNNYSVAYRKQQLWQLENGRWKIIFEGRT